ncbi:D-inositol-3-phosphate glycosyltransferase [subsurface metagenome]
MKRIAICTSEISYGDAVSNDVLGMFNVLKKQNYKVCIFAENIFISEDIVKSIDLISNFIKDSEDLVVYHLCSGWFKGLDILAKLDCIKIVKYHNITPPDYFYGFSKIHVETCKGGIEQLNIIDNLNIAMYLNDSRFNMIEMISRGPEASKCFIVPPFNNIERLKNLKPDFDILNKYNDEKVNILSVGRVVPNKGFAELIDAFALYNKYFNKESRLIIVGNIHSSLTVYNNYLNDKVRYMNLENSVIFTGKVNDEQLKSYFLVSKIFTLTSYHEGFCVPLVEAMSMKIPVIAYGSTAVTDTVGNGGIVWEDLDINLIAATINEIISDRDTYFFLGEAGRRRYKNNFTNEIIEENFLSTVRKYL